MLLVTRPQPEAGKTAKRLRTRKQACAVAPLLLTQAKSPRKVDVRNTQLLVVTSPAAARALQAWEALHPLPVLAVGKATQTLLKKSGFKKVRSADGDAKALVACIKKTVRAKTGRIMLATAPLTGQKLAAELKALGYRTRRLDVYSVAAVKSLPAAALTFLADKKAKGVLFYSPQTAKAFVAGVKKARLMDCTRRLTAYALSIAVASAAAGLKWQRIVVAKQPNETSLLEQVGTAHGRRHTR